MITVTAPAQAKVRSLLEDEDEEGLFLRMAVRPGGCSGFEYEMFFDSESEDDDLVHMHEGFDVVLDKASAQLLQGATLNYVDTLEKSGFDIDNPNAQRTCGCGQSFS